MTLIFRNLIHVIRRFKLATVLNILGLSVAFASFIIIMMQLNFHFTFDRFHKDYDKIFRVEVFWAGTTGATYTPTKSRPLAEAVIASSPHILAGAVKEPRLVSHFFYVERDGSKHHFYENVRRVKPEFFDVFTFDFIEGNADAFDADGHLIIPQSLAQRMFGDEPAVGRHLTYSWGTLPISAVYRDFPNNSIFENTMFQRIPVEQNAGNWGYSAYTAFIRVNDASVVSTLFENFKRTFDAQAVFGQYFSWEENPLSMRFTALPDIYFTTDTMFDHTPKGSRHVQIITSFGWQ